MPSARRLWELSLKVSMTIEKKNIKGDDTHHLSFGIRIIYPIKAGIQSR